MSDTSNIKEVQDNMENLRNQLGLLLFHKQTLEALCEELKKKFESKIWLSPTANFDVRSNELEKDVVSLKNATKEILEARYQFYQYQDELAMINTRISAIKLTWNQYSDHIKQYFDRNKVEVNIQMVEAKIAEATQLKNLSDDENKTLDNLLDQWPKIMNTGKFPRSEFYETLKDFILQHG